MSYFCVKITQDMAREVKKIVVMGGSFNPPTVAHYRLMKQAIETFEADIGLFVPVSDAYLKRKMRHSKPPLILSPELRIRMLRTMCTDERMDVCEMEIGTIKPRTMPTLVALQEENPDAELYFLMGDDKLDLLSNLTVKAHFLDFFKVGLYSREDDTVVQSLQNNETLSGYQDRITILPQPEGTEGISSSLVRKRMMSGESSQELLCEGVWELFKDFTASDFPETINKFSGDYYFLSNRFGCRFVWQGLSYGSAEAAFQSSECSTGAEQLAIMESILEAKFDQNPELMDKLRATGNSILVNGNSKKDTFWGVDLYSWLGDNQLGKILMKIRDKER